MLTAIVLMVFVMQAQAQSCTAGRALVSGYFSGVHIYDACTGAFERVLDTVGRIRGAQAIWPRPDGKIYVVSEESGQMLRYDSRSLAFIDAFIDTGLTFKPTGIAFAPNGDIYVGGFEADAVRRYNGQTGALIDTPVPGNAGLDDPDNGMTFGPDGKLYIPSYESNSVVRFDPATGITQTFISAGVGGLRHTRQVLFEPGANTILVSSEGSNRILRFNAVTGALVGTFATASRPAGMNYTVDGRLLVATNSDQVQAFNATSGVSSGPLFATSASGGLLNSTYVALLVPSAEPPPNVTTEIVSVRSAGPNFGWEVDPIGDLNADGVSDFIAATPNRNADSGAVEVRSGKDGALLFNLSNNVASSQFGYAIDDAGDFNHDGYNDIIVGAPRAGGRGAAYVYSGKTGAQLWTQSGDRANGQFGSRVASAGDVDGDGFADVMVGAEEYPDPVAGTGRVFVYTGQTGAMIRSFAAQANGEAFGSGLETVGDLDGDRKVDFVIGAYRGGAERRGRAYAFSSVTGNRLLTFESPAGAGNFGQAFVSDAGDFNNDGKEDIYIGDFGANGGAGRALVYSGRDASILFRVEGTGSDGVGTGRGVHDLNGDGIGDLIIGHWTQDNSGAPQAGRVVVHAGPDGRVLQTTSSSTAGENFGFDAGSVDDVNDDGRADLLVGAATGNRVVVIAGTEKHGEAVMNPGARLSGLWYDPTHNGEGFVLEVLDDSRAVVYWFTYTANGAKRYFVGTGTIVGKRIVFSELYTTKGGRFGSQFVSADVRAISQSNLTLRFDSCDTGYADYTVDGVRGQQRLQRIARRGGLACADPAPLPSAAGLSGSWYKPSAAGEGWTLQMLGTNAAVIEWFSYGADGNQEWFLGTGTLVGNTINFNEILRPNGGRFGPYFLPSEVISPAVGSLRMQFQSCNSATMRWSGAFGNGETVVARLTDLKDARCSTIP